MLDSECKTKSAATFFHDFKTPEKYDASKEPLPVLVEAEQTEEIKNSEKIKKPLEQKKLTTKE